MNRIIPILATVLLTLDAGAGMHRTGGPKIPLIGDHGMGSIPESPVFVFTSEPGYQTSDGTSITEWHEYLSGAALTVDGDFANTAPSVYRANGVTVPWFANPVGGAYCALNSLALAWCPASYELTDCNPWEFALVGQVTDVSYYGNGSGFGGVCTIFGRCGDTLGVTPVPSQYATTNTVDSTKDVSGATSGDWQWWDPSWSTPLSGGPQGTVWLENGAGSAWVTYWDGQWLAFGLSDDQGAGVTLHYTQVVVAPGPAQGTRPVVGGAEGTWAGWDWAGAYADAEWVSTPCVFGMSYTYSHSRTDLTDNSPITTIWDTSVAAFLSEPMWQEGTVWKNAGGRVAFAVTNNNSTTWRYDWGGRAVSIGRSYDNLSTGYGAGMTGWVGEFYGYRRKLADAERLQLTLFAMKKYGVAP